MRATLIFLTLFLGLTICFAQKQIKGKITDAKGHPVGSVNVSLKDAAGNTLSFTRTNDLGAYSLVLKQDQKQLSLEATTIGYEKKIIHEIDPSKPIDFVMQESEISLKTVVVKNRPALTLRGDTLNYHTSDFADKQDRSIGDVIRKMPGITVEESGKVSYNGKPISALYIDGDNVLDDKYSIGTKSIPHGVVETVQVIEKDQPVKMLRKNNMSEDVALNLVIKDGAKLKVMGDVCAGLGTPERFDGNANAMLFKKEFKFINNLKGNNIGIDPSGDLTSFNFEDYLTKLDNSKPAGFLSAGAAGVPTLPQNRTLFNRAGLINLNNLYKLNDTWQVKANVGYVRDQRNQQYNKFAQTYLREDTITYNEFQENNTIPSKFQAKFNTLGNADGFYFNNTLQFNYTGTGTNAKVTSNGVAANQHLMQDTYDWSNELSYRKKLKSDYTFNVYSFLNRTTQPELLSISPGLNEAILNNGVPYAGLNQYIKLPTWYANTYIAFSSAGTAFTQTYKVGFSIQQQHLNSELYRIQNNQISELVSPAMTNNLDWRKSKVYTDAIYEYRAGKFRMTLILPLSYNSIHYQEEEKVLNEHLNRFFVNPSLNLKYKTGIENDVTANYAFKNELGNLNDVYRGTILKNYRSLFSNNAPISLRKTHQIEAAFNFKKAIQMLFINANLGYSVSSINTISAYTLSNNLQQRIVLPLINDMKSISSAVNASKYLFNLKSTVNVGIAWSQSTFQQLQNTELLPFTSQNMNYKAGIDTKFSSFLNWSYNANYSVSKNKTNEIRNNNQQIRQQSSVTATLFGSVFTTISAEHIFTHQAAQPNLSYVFADFNMRYKWQKLKTDLELSVTNLADVQKFEANYLSANAFSSGTYYIPGRIAMIKATFNF